MAPSPLEQPLVPRRRMRGLSCRSSLVAHLCGALLLFLCAGCGNEGRGAGDRTEFKSSERAYYASFYATAIGEALPPEERSPEEIERIQAKVRERSRLWSTAPSERLSLVGDRFVFTFAALAGIPKGTHWADAEVKATSREYRGAWRRTGEKLVLHVEVVDGLAIKDPYDWEMTWKGREVVIPGWRGGGPFAGSILEQL